MQTEQLTTEQANKAIVSLLNEYGIYYTVSLVGETTRDNDWKCDEWRVTVHKDKKEEIFQYYTGVGLRSKPKTLVNCGYTDKGKPVAPHIASILHSLLLDSEAVNQCFSDWCSGFGFDDDSIKALGVYNACCDIGKQMRRLFSTKQQETLRELLQDY